MSATGRTIPCFGIMCEKHGECHRYVLVENSSPEQVRLDYCGKEGERHLFLPREIPVTVERREK